jgi:hypothetical protein
MCSLALCEVNLFHFCISVPNPLPRPPPPPRCCFCFCCRPHRQFFILVVAAGERALGVEWSGVEWSCVLLLLLVVDGGEAIPLRSQPPRGIPPISTGFQLLLWEEQRQSLTCSHEITALRLERRSDLEPRRVWKVFSPGLVIFSFGLASSMPGCYTQERES